MSMFNIQHHFTLYIEIPKTTKQREPSIVHLNIWNTSVFLEEKLPSIEQSQRIRITESEFFSRKMIQNMISTV